MREILLCLLPYLPEVEEDKAAKRDGEHGPADREPLARRYKNDRPYEPTTGPSSSAGPPLLEDPPEDTRIMALLLNARLGRIMGDTEKDTLLDAATALMAAARMAGAQIAGLDDMRSDLLEYALFLSAWESGPMEGNPVSGNQVSVRFGDQEAGGEVFEQALSLSNDGRELERVIDEARPVTDALRSVLYPNITQMPLAERFSSSGSLDPTRLSASSCSEVIYRRIRVHDVADRKGSPYSSSPAMDRARSTSARLICSRFSPPHGFSRRRRPGYR